MKRQLLTEIIIALLVLLFVYAGISKLLDMTRFEKSMQAQPFPHWMNGLLVYALPFTELITALALGFNKTRGIALYAYATLMLCFTSYASFVLAGVFKHPPCGCGGIIGGLGWERHFIINLIFLVLTCLAIRLHRQGNIFMHKQGVSQKPVKE